MYVFDLISAMSDLVVVYVAILVVFFFLRSQRQKKRTVSLDFIKRWNDGRYQRIFSNILSEPGNESKDIRDILTDRAVRWGKDSSSNDIESIWNFYEELSIAILFGEADEEIAKEFFIYSLVNTYRISERALYKIRSRNNKALYLNMERLYGKWTSEKEYLVVKEVLK